ncbi:OsmC family protein [Pseudoruegeria sp. SK021]|uniref:OsmC family protein n=1 Tax=Pseudoruegeria sp. SK021 TaxID=1933035 RepID=UPI000A238410|nr:OsmC family protein [Pseudoruegeria sp. SK021]OSP54388.1 hypothetical protein BV911_12985 [Pseudoruegeria sp. SK021]
MVWRNAVNVLGSEAQGLVFDAVDAPANQVSALTDSGACRMVAWSVSGFQKVGVLSNAATGRAWRMASDEGPNLHGWDAAPPPLGFLSVGFALSFAEEIQALARLRGIDLGRFGISVDNFYSVDGKMRDKTMHGGALPFTVTVTPGQNTGQTLDNASLMALVSDAVHVASVAGAVREQWQGQFRGYLNQRPLALSHPAPVSAPVADPRPICEAQGAGRPVSHILTAGNWSRASTTGHPLHVSAGGMVVPDAPLDLYQELRAPCGSGWRFLAGGADAPDAASYVSAGIGFCFMTQLEILAGLLDVDLNSVRLVQDTRFGQGGASSGTGQPATFAPVETHIFVESDTASPEQVVELIDLAERACYLHALCRTALKPLVRISETQIETS